MSTTTEKVCIEVLSLPRNARAEIAHRLLVSLEGEDFADDVNESWRGEINRRREDFREGRAKGVPAEEALRQAHAAIE
jgi:putative addiction module component (TIGR02574 family)